MEDETQPAHESPEGAAPQSFADPYGAHHDPSVPPIGVAEQTKKALLADPRFWKDEATLAVSPYRIRQGVILAAAAIGISLITGLLLSISVAQVMGTDAWGSASWLSGLRESVLTPGLFFVLSGAAFGGGLDVTVNASGSFGIGFTAQGTVAAVAWGAVVGLAALAWWTVRHHERAQAGSLAWPQAVVRSLFDALPASLLTVLVFGFAQASFEGSQPSVATVSSRGWAMLFTVLGAVAVPLFVSRWKALRKPGLTPLRIALREAVSVFAWCGAVLAVAAVIGAVVAVASNDLPGSVPLAMLPYLGNVAFALFTWGVGAGLHLSLGGPLVTSLAAMAGPESKSGHDHLYFAWDFSAVVFVVLLVLVILTLLFAMVRIGARRPRTSSVEWKRTWQLPVAAFILGLIGLWSTGLSVVGTAGITIMAANQGGGATAGFGPVWYTPLLIAVLAALISCGAEFLPMFVFQMAPRLFLLLAGRTASGRWLGGRLVAPERSGVRPPMPAAPPGVADVGALQSGQPGQSGPSGQPVEAEGYPVASGNDVVTHPPEITAMSPRTKARIRRGVVVILSLGVLIGAAAGAVAFLNSTRNPDAVVRSYAELLQAGNAAEASKMVDPGISYAQRTLLTDKAMEGGSRIQVVSVEVKEKRDKDATVTLTYSLDGQRSTKDFTVVKGDPEFGLLDTWQLREPFLAQVSIATAGLDTVTVNRQPVSVPEGSGLGGVGTTDSPDHVLSVPVYPGIYTVSAASTKFVAVQSQRLIVQGDAASSETGNEVTLKKTITPAAETAVLDQVKAFATACVTVPSNTADGCPYPLQSTKLHSMKLLTAPSTVTIENDGSFVSDAAKFEYTRDPYYDGDKPEPETIEYAFRGKATVTPDSVKATDITYTYG